jgi:protein involved in polysaccharide export with SLBB domain
MLMMTVFARQPVGLRKRATRFLLGGLVAIFALSGSGCAALSNPVGMGIPARRLPPEYLASSKDDLKSIPLPTLGQPKMEKYELDAGDTLGVFIDGVLGKKEESPPINPVPADSDFPPGVGYPILIRYDGTLSLPLLKPFKVKGKTLGEVEDDIRKAVVDQGILQPNALGRIMVSLVLPRRYNVQVVRQEAQQVGAFGAQSVRRVSASIPVNLFAYRNDVLNALNKSGGLPGLDSVNEIRIQRRLNDGSIKIIYIPLRIPDGEPIPFKESDVLLENNDVVFIEGRDTEVYYVLGLPIASQYSLPRDYDLRVIEALTTARAPLVNGGINQNNLNSQFLPTGIGSPSPSFVSVIRRTKEHGQVIIKVNLNRAFNDPRENIIVMPGDQLVLQETVGEAMTRYVTSVFRVNVSAILFPRFQAAGQVTGNLP